MMSGPKTSSMEYTYNPERAEERSLMRLGLQARRRRLSIQDHVSPLRQVLIRPIQNSSGGTWMPLALTASLLCRLTLSMRRSNTAGHVTGLRQSLLIMGIASGTFASPTKKANPKG